MNVSSLTQPKQGLHSVPTWDEAEAPTAHGRQTHRGRTAPARRFTDRPQHAAAAAPPRLAVAVADDAGDDLRVSVLGSFAFRTGDHAHALGATTRKLLALLALRDKPMTRLLLAGTLWPDATDQEAAGSLRSALWRLKPDVADAIEVEDLDLRLAADVRVDFRESMALAHRVLDNSAPSFAAGTVPSTVSALSADLLPGWRDDWMVLAAEEWHQLRLHALERMSERLAAEGRWAEATTAALAAVRSEPLRETAHGALIRVFLGEGNQAEALEQFHGYRSLLQAELGLEPTDRIGALVQNLGRRSTDR